MSLWNPYAFNVLGDPLPPAAPPALRVYGGEATAVQLASAQSVFAVFSEGMRMSYVPNPTELGRLPDGSIYRITVVGNTATMEMWVAGLPAEETTKPVRGVGLGVVLDGRNYLLVLFFVKGEWAITQVASMYGGSGVWASSTSGVYFTDDSIPAYPGSFGAPSNSSRGLPKSVACKMHATSVCAGLAYDVVASSRHGMASRAGKYVQFSVNGYGSGGALALGVGVYEAALLTAKEFAVTPTVHAAVPRLVDELIVAHPPGVANLAMGEIKGRGGFSRLRSGRAVVLPMVDISEPLFRSGAYGGDDWITPLSLTHELSVNMAADGQYSAEITPHAAVEIVIRIPEEQPTSKTKPWRFEESHAGRHDAKPTQVSGGPRGGAIGLAGGKTSSINVRKVTRHDKSRAPVYAARDWNDAVISMMLRFEDSCVVRSDRDQYEEYDVGFVSPVRGNPDGYEITGYSIEPCAPPNAPLCAYIDHSPRPPGVGFLNLSDYSETNPDPGGKYSHGVAITDIRSTTDTSITRAANAVLETPWGDVPLYSTNNVIKVQRVVESDGAATNTLEGVSGTDTFKNLMMIDPVLAIVGFMEFTVGGYGISMAGDRYSISSTGSTARFVILHRGVEILSHAVSEFRESSVSTDAYVTKKLRQVRPREIRDTSTEEQRVIISGSGSDAGWEEEPRARYVTFTAEYKGAASSYEAEPWVAHVESDDVISCPRPSMDFSMDYYKVVCAVDPNSGGGVAMAIHGGTVLGSWAISPDGTREELNSAVSRLWKTPEAINPFAISV